jgi:hypothetical protein
VYGDVSSGVETTIERKRLSVDEAKEVVAIPSGSKCIG